MSSAYEYKLGVGDLRGKLFRRSRDNDVVAYAELDASIPAHQGTFVTPGPWATWGFVAPSAMDAIWNDLRMFSHDPVRLDGSRVLPQSVEVSYRVRNKTGRTYRRTGDLLDVFLDDCGEWTASKEGCKLLSEWDNPAVFCMCAPSDISDGRAFFTAMLPPPSPATPGPSPVVETPSSQMRAVEHRTTLDIRIVEQASVTPVSWDDLPLNHMFRTCGSTRMPGLAYVKTGVNHFVANGYRSLVIRTLSSPAPEFIDLGPAEYSFSDGRYRVKPPEHAERSFSNGLRLPLGTAYRVPTGHVWIRALNGAISVDHGGTFLVADEDDVASATGTVIGPASVTADGLKFNP